MLILAKEKKRKDIMSIFYQNIEFFETNYVGYFVSKCGKIFSEKTKKILKHKIDKDGYCVYVFSNNGVRKDISGHRLVAETFLDNPENKPTVNHIDGNKSNNNVSNLEWATYSENNHHRFDILNYKQKSDYSIDVIHDKTLLTNLSRADCTKLGIKRTYLNCLIDGTTNSFYMFFDKNDNGIDIYLNGEILLHFNSIKETAEYFKLKRNSVSTKINHHKPVEYVTKNYKISINFK